MKLKHRLFTNLPDFAIFGVSILKEYANNPTRFPLNDHYSQNYELLIINNVELVVESATRRGVDVAGDYLEISAAVCGEARTHADGRGIRYPAQNRQPGSGPAKCSIRPSRTGPAAMEEHRTVGKYLRQRGPVRRRGVAKNGEPAGKPAASDMYWLKGSSSE